MSARPHWLRSYRSERHAALDWPACNSGPCDQGRKVCPSPEACQRAEINTESLHRFADFVIAAGAVAVIGMLVFGVFG